MQSHEARRALSRPWPTPEVSPHGLPAQRPPANPPVRYGVPGVPPTASGPTVEAANLLKAVTSANIAGPGQPPPTNHSARFQPYRVPPLHPKHQFEFTLQEINHCLYGKQEMKVVQINDVKHEGPVSKGSPSIPPGTNISKEDKNKPAKWCDLCQEIRFGDCPEHGPLPTAQRPPLTLPGPKSYAVSTFPDEVGLCISTIPNAGYGVYARLFIPYGTWIGPYEGKRISVDKGLKQLDDSFMWEIYENSKLAYYLDASDESTSSWMRFIQCARHLEEQNLFVFQYHGSIYYRAFKDIPQGTELLVWYDQKYPQYFGIPHDIRDLSLHSMDSRCVQASSETSRPSEYENALMTHNVRIGESQHHPGGQLIQGKIIQSTDTKPRERTSSTRSVYHVTSTFQSPTGQPPKLSEATPISSDRRLPPDAHTFISPQRHSPRSGSVKPSFRHEGPHQPSSSMLRSMSADDLRRHGPPHAHEGGMVLDHCRDHMESRMAFGTDHTTHTPHPTIPSSLHGLVLHPVPRGAAMSHFSPRLPPSVMSITPVSKNEHIQTAAEKDSIKHAHPYHAEHLDRNIPHERVVDQERFLRDRDLLMERTTSGRLRIPSVASVKQPTHIPLDRRSSDRLPHAKIRAGQESANEYEYLCKLCRKKFNQKTAFEQHHCEIPKPYQCGRCELAFRDPHDLQEHMVIHTSDRPFRCGHCSRSFQSSDSLKIHMYMHDMGKKPLPQPLQPPLPQEHSSIKSFIDCLKCGKRFHSSSDMEKHLKSPGECVS